MPSIPAICEKCKRRFLLDYIALRELQRAGTVIECGRCPVRTTPLTAFEQILLSMPESGSIEFDRLCVTCYKKFPDRFQLGRYKQTDSSRVSMELTKMVSRGLLEANSRRYALTDKGKEARCLAMQYIERLQRSA